MNKYQLVFPFEGKYEFVEVTANQLANELLPSNDEFTDFQMDTDGQYFEHHFKRYINNEEKSYTATFTIGDPYTITIYDDSLDVDAIVEKVSWVCYRITDSEDNYLFQL